MVAPIVAAAGISGGLGLLGGMLSDRSARSTASKQRQMDVEFAKNQIAWKVADAKRAGIHPLYALGSSGSYSPTNIVQSQSNTGTALGRAGEQIADMYMQSQSQKKQLSSTAALTAAQVNAANQQAKRNEAEAALALSQSKRVEQEINQSALGRNVPDMYITVRNNHTGELVQIPNPELGIEMPETVGLGYWLRGKYYDLGRDTPKREQRRRQEIQRMQQLSPDVMKHRNPLNFGGAM